MSFRPHLCQQAFSLKNQRAILFSIVDQVLYMGNLLIKRPTTISVIKSGQRKLFRLCISDSDNFIVSVATKCTVLNHARYQVNFHIDRRLICTASWPNWNLGSHSKLIFSFSERAIDLCYMRYGYHQLPFLFFWYFDSATSTWFMLHISVTLTWFMFLRRPMRCDQAAIR